MNASDGHFILELIQNFEDNEYGPARPMMLFHLSNDLLFVACNEVGMKPTDVYSLCNVADSTKKDNKYYFVCFLSFVILVLMLLLEGMLTDILERKESGLSLSLR